MNYSISMRVKSMFHKGPILLCSESLWLNGVAELHRRTYEEQESGAFLLGINQDRSRIIHEFLFYDDIDPYCFRHGIVEFDGRALGQVWKKCRDNGLSVVADVHVHPYGFAQSNSDRANPIMAERGHIALILPCFASVYLPGEIGIYEYLGNRKWKNYSHKGKQVFAVEG
jgi:proteasome lid subunit RPN8/RPN11